MGEKSHPLWIIRSQPDLPINVPWVPSRALAGAHLNRPGLPGVRYTIPVSVLLVREDMSGGGPSILVVDPDESFLRTTSTALKSEGFEYGTAKRADEAARKLESGACEVIVVNLDMPGGLDLLRSPGEHGASVPVVAVTSRPSVATAVQALRFGAVDYLAKPVQKVDLLQAVERAVEKGRALRAVRGVEQVLGACARWFRDVETLLAVPGAWNLPPAVRAALTERREGGALDQLLVRYLGAHEVNALTRRERDVLVAFCQGRRGRDLARGLGVSVNTCRTHVKSLLKKLGCHSQRELLERLGGGSPRGSE